MTTWPTISRIDSASPESRMASPGWNQLKHRLPLLERRCSGNSTQNRSFQPAVSSPNHDHKRPHPGCIHARPRPAPSWARESMGGKARFEIAGVHAKAGQFDHWAGVLVVGHIRSPMPMMGMNTLYGDECCGAQFFRADTSRERLQSSRRRLWRRAVRRIKTKG